MAAFNKMDIFTEDMAHGVHDLETDQLTVALVANANGASLVAQTAALLGTLTEATYTFLSTRNITTSTSGQTDGTYDLVLTDLTLTSTGGATGPFRYVVIYNDGTAGKVNPLIASFDYGSDLTLQDGESLTIDFASNGASPGSLFTFT